VPKGRPSRKKKTIRENATAEGGLQGWAAIAKFLGQPVAVAQRWEELSRWLDREAGIVESVHVAQEGDDDLLKELRRLVRNGKASEPRTKVSRQQNC